MIATSCVKAHTQAYKALFMSKTTSNVSTQNSPHSHSGQQVQAISALKDNFVIPDLCQINSVLFTLILTQFLAFFIALISTQGSLVDWEILGLYSIYCHALVLSFSVCICLTRKFLFDAPAKWITLYYLGVNLLLTLLISWFGSQVIMPGIVSHPILFVVKSMLVSLVLAAITLRYFFLRQDWQRQRQAELQARIQSLQARIRPHFLFNSMNSIASLIMTDPQRAEDAVLDLSALFRATLNNQKTMIPIGEELKLCRQYLNIEGIRLGDRLQVEWQLENLDLNFPIPPLLLQPLFENAIYHGIQPLEKGGQIKVMSQITKGQLYILISNPVEQLESTHRGNRIALNNIQSRLQAIYGEDAILKTSRLDGVFTVTIRIPTT